MINLHYYISVFLLFGCSKVLNPTFPGGIYPPQSFDYRPEAIPFNDLRFDVESKRNAITVTISSEKWDIVGFGTGSMSDELVIDSVAGVPDNAGSKKSHEVLRRKGEKINVYFMESQGRRQFIGTF